MDINYRSTRSNDLCYSASQAIVKGLADDGGLFVPETFPKLKKSLYELSKMNYRDVAYEVMSLFYTDFTEEELRYCINNAYDDKFDTDEIAPLAQVGDDYYLELFHGATIAFKDMALSILPYLMTTAAKKNNIEEDIVILTATSGDTGKAALAGFADVPGTKIMVFYPKNGVSAIQERQMVTQKGDNVRVIGITGNFDDAQTGVKNIFGDKEFAEEITAKGYRFSSANSINIGRLIPQVAYYVYAYAKLVAEERIKEGDAINFTVPTGNFGNILAGFYAKKLGVPVNKLICASNENKVLFDFFGNGVYNRNRDFILTTSPSMDILISSNLERLIYYVAGDNAQANAQFMSDLASSGEYTITKDMKDKIDRVFVGGFASEEEVAKEILSVYDKTGYIMDTHTAVASAAYKKYVAQTEDKTTNVIVSTASPYKFTRAVCSAINGDVSNESDFDLVDSIYIMSGVAIPNAIEEIRTAPVLHDIVCDKEDMKDQVRKFLNI